MPKTSSIIEIQIKYFKFVMTWSGRDQELAVAKNERDQELAALGEKDLDLNWSSAISVYNRLLKQSLEEKPYSFEEFLKFFEKVITYYNERAPAAGSDYAEQETEKVNVLIHKLNEYRTAATFTTPAAKITMLNPMNLLS